MKKTDALIERAFLDCETFAAKDGKDRTFTFVAATESRIDRFGGALYFDMDGMDLARYSRNPIVIDTHDTESVGSAIGTAQVRVEDRQLVADITFAGTERAEDAFQLVKAGVVRAVSVGVVFRNIEEVEDGSSAALGEREIQGPASIVRKWELFEISVVPVPANADALRRFCLDGDISGFAPIVQGLGRTVERLCAGKAQDKPAQLPAQEELKQELGKEVARMSDTPVENKVVELAAPQSERTAIDNEIMRLAALTEVPEIAERAKALCLGLRSVDEARVEIMRHFNATLAPVGTPAAPEEQSADNPGENKQTVYKTFAEVPDEAFVAAICNT